MLDDLDEGLWEYVMIEEFLGEIRKEFRRKDKKKEKIREKKAEEDIWGGLDSFCNRYSVEEVRQVEKDKEVLIVAATILRKQMARRGYCYETMKYERTFPYILV